MRRIARRAGRGQQRCPHRKRSPGKPCVAPRSSFPWRFGVTDHITPKCGQVGRQILSVSLWPVHGPLGSDPRERGSCPGLPTRGPEPSSNFLGHDPRTCTRTRRKVQLSVVQTACNALRLLEPQRRQRIDGDRVLCGQVACEQRSRHKNRGRQRTTRRPGARLRIAESSRERDSSNDPRTPIAIPTRTLAKAWRRTITIRCTLRAPSAIRMPSSRVRSRTV